MSIIDTLPPKLLEQLRVQLSYEFALVELLAPHKDKADIYSSLNADLEEQLTLSQVVIPTLIDPKAVQKEPYMQIAARLSSEPLEKELAFSAYKRMDNPDAMDDTEEALKTALLVAFLTSSGARKLLKICGHSYRFIGVANLKAKPVIIH